MEDIQERLALAEQQAKARRQSKFDRLKQIEERLCAIAKELEGAKKTSAALESEKTEIEAECEEMKQELETDITALTGVNGAPIDESSLVGKQGSSAASKKPVGAVNQPDISNTKAPTSAVQTPTRPDAALPSRPTWATKHPSAATGSSTSPARASEPAAPVSQNLDQPRTSHKPTAAPSTRPAPEVPQCTAATNDSTTQADAQEISTPLVNSSHDPYTPAQQKSDTSNHQSSTDRAGDKFNATPRSEVDSIPYNLQTGPGQLVKACVHKTRGLKGFATVMLMDGEWTEVKCSICGRNAMKEGHEERYIGHMSGLYNHIRSHLEGEDKKDIEKIFEHIERRKVNDEDVALMKAGMKPKVEIPMNLGNPSAGNPKHNIAGKRKMESSQSASSLKKLKTVGNSTAKGDAEQLPAVKAGSTTKPTIKLKPTPKKSNAGGLPVRPVLPGNNL